jgi:hypothetical protein
VRGITEAAGQALRRAPYGWFVATLAVYWLLLRVESRLSTVADGGGDASFPLAIAAVVLITGGVVSSVVIVPRFVVPPMRRPGSEGQTALLRWAFAAAPFPPTLAFVMAGGPRWPLAVGFVTSAALLASVARTLRRDASTSRT